MQCHVIAVGNPSRVVRRAASTAKGDTTPMWTWGDVVRAQLVPHPQRCEGVDRQVGGQPQLVVVDGDAVDDARRAVPLAVRARCGGEDLDVVAAGPQVAGEVVDLHLDAPEPREVAVREEGDLHTEPASHERYGRMAACPTRSWPSTPTLTTRRC